MKINYTLLVILLTASVVFYPVIADSENAVDAKNSVLPVPAKSNDSVDEIDPKKKGKANNLDKNDSKGLDPKGGVRDQKKANAGIQKDDPKENEGLNSRSKKESNEGRSSTVKVKCDSSSNHCTNDDKTLVACLRVPGNESPELSLLIENKGKGSLSIIISAPDSVQLETERIELQENKDTEVKVSIKGVENGHFIVLTTGPGHGNCSLNFRDQFVGGKRVDQSSDSSHLYTFKLTSFTGFVFSAALLLAVVSVFTCTKLGRKYFARKGLKYQMLDMELPVSHGSKPDAGKDEGWDDSWGDSWDDEEAPTTPSFPVTPSLSSKGMASRKFKEGWKD